MKHLTKLTVFFMLLSLLSCEKQPASDLSRFETKAVSHAPSKYEGDWIFVGLAHPWNYGDLGAAGVVSISGLEVTLQFILSPAAGLHGVRSPFCFIPEGDSSISITGRLSPVPDPEGYGGTFYPYTIEDTGTDFDGMPIWTDPGLEHSILIGMFDPPLMFRSSSAPPIVIRKTDDTIIGDDPFANPEVDPSSE
ncbi:MAG: hypothetical protein ACI9FG_001698 [Crocinitomicaceae bacterium]|jgi:hypothetical protein